MPRIITDSFSYRVSFKFCGQGTLSYCLLLLICNSCKIGGDGKKVQINVKCNCYCGHRVEGQWVFRGIDQDSQKCYILTAKYHSPSSYERMDCSKKSYCFKLLEIMCSR